VRDEPGSERIDTSEVRLDILRSRLLTWDQLDRLPAPARLIGDYLVQNSLAALYGRPGTGKSFIAMSMAFSVVTGQSFFGHQTVQGPVLYVAAEGTAGLPQRQRAWREMCPDGDLSDMHWLPCAVSLIDVDWAMGLAKLTAELAPRLVIIDTLNRSMPGGDENSSIDMSALVSACDQIREMSGATVLLVHHTPKDGTTLRGHSALEGAVDTALLMEAAGDKLITLTVTKQKDIATIDRLVLELVPVGTSVVPMESHEGRETVTDFVQSERVVRETVWDHGETHGLTIPLIVELTGLSRASVYRAKKSLIDRGLIKNIGTAKTPRYVAGDDFSVSQSHGSLTESHEPVSGLISPPPFRGVRHETTGGEK
jgi:hypothetical protein